MPESTEQGLTVTQSFVARGLEKQTITALADKVIVKSKNLFREFTLEYDYTELKPTVVRWRDGDGTWTNIALYLIVLAFVGGTLLNLIFPKEFPEVIYRIFPLICVILAIVTFLLRFIKYDQVLFFEKDSSFGFGISLSQKNRQEHERVVDYIIVKIKQAESFSKSNQRQNLKS